MSLFNRIFVICIAAMCTAGLVSAAFAQTSDTASGNERGNMQRTADLVNLMRTILDPNPAPVLASPAERAVSGKTTADPASPVATTVPVVTMPDIEPPEEESGEPDKVDTGTGKPAQSAVAASASKKDADETDPAPYPPFYYVFFYGEYVPFFEGWYYYSGRWLWGRLRPTRPDGSRLLPRRVPGLLNPSVRTSDRDRAPESPETAAVPPRGEPRLVPPHPHRKARTNRETRSRSCRNAIVSRAKMRQGANHCRKIAISRSRRVSTAFQARRQIKSISRKRTTKSRSRRVSIASRAEPPDRTPLRRTAAISRLHPAHTASRGATADFTGLVLHVNRRIRLPSDYPASCKAIKASDHSCF